MGIVHNRGTLMVNDQYQRCFRQRSVNASGRRMAMQVIFQYHHGISTTCFQFGQRIIK
ncbi:hypothetical protein D3C81_1913540 [compost metagenome]